MYGAIQIIRENNTEQCHRISHEGGRVGVKKWQVLLELHFLHNLLLFETVCLKWIWMYKYPTIKFWVINGPKVKCLETPVYVFSSQKVSSNWVFWVDICFVFYDIFVELMQSNELWCTLHLFHRYIKVVSKIKKVEKGQSSK